MCRLPSSGHRLLNGLWIFLLAFWLAIDPFNSIFGYPHNINRRSDSYGSNRFKRYQKSGDLIRFKFTEQPLLLRLRKKPLDLIALTHPGNVGIRTTKPGTVNALFFDDMDRDRLSGCSVVVERNLPHGENRFIIADSENHKSHHAIAFYQIERKELISLEPLLIHRPLIRVHEFKCSEKRFSNAVFSGLHLLIKASCFSYQRASNRRVRTKRSRRVFIDMGTSKEKISRSLNFAKRPALTLSVPVRSLAISRNGDFAIRDNRNDRSSAADSLPIRTDRRAKAEQKKYYSPIGLGSDIPERHRLYGQPRKARPLLCHLWIWTLVTTEKRGFIS
jgi:hypothetical protein